MKNKKVLVCLLTAAMTLGLTACGGESKSQSKKENFRSMTGFLRRLLGKFPKREC